MTGSQREALLGPRWHEWTQRIQARAATGWIDMVRELGELQDAVAAAAPPAQAVAEIRSLLTAARSRLSEHQVGDAEQLFGRLYDLPDRAQTLVPPIHVLEAGQDWMTARTTFGRFHAGSGGAVHGGSIGLLFDELLGVVADGGDDERCRTASLTIDYRSVTPLEVPLTLHAETTEVIGRKRYVTGTMRHGDRLCAEGRGLFLTLLPGQP